MRRLEIMERKLSKPQPWVMRVAAAIDILRCVAWFEYVRDYLQTNVSLKLKTPYAIGKFIQPHTYRGASADFSHNNLWHKYAAGLHCPSRATLAVVEEKVPRATAIFDAPVWKMLNMACPVGSQIDDDLRTLSMGVQESLYDRKLLGFGMYRRRKVGQAMLSSLERRATGLDSLAAAVLLLKEACDVGDSEQRFRVGESLHRILLMTCISAPVSSYRLPLIAYFSLFVFPMASSDSLVIDVPIVEFYEMTTLLNAYVAILEDHGVIRCENAGLTRERRGMLVGDLGMDLKFGFMPRLKVAPGCQDLHVNGDVASQTVGKEWGLSVLRRYGYVDFPPERVLLDMIAAYDGVVSALDA
jgi:hypothetical protein